jgi:hypothetical protein
MRPDRSSHLTADGAVTGIGEMRDRIGERGRNLGRDRNQVFPVCRVYPHML